MWGLFLSTRVWKQQRGAWDAAISSPGALNEVQIHLVRRLRTKATQPDQGCKTSRGGPHIAPPPLVGGCTRLKHSPENTLF